MNVFEQEEENEEEEVYELLYCSAVVVASLFIAIRAAYIKYVSTY